MSASRSGRSAARELGVAGARPRLAVRPHLKGRRQLLLSMLAVSLIGCQAEHRRVRGDGSATRTAATARAAATATGAAAAVTANDAPIELRWQAMGTEVRMTAYRNARRDRDAVRRALDGARKEIARLERMMSSWRADSEVGRINAAAGERWVPVSAETWQVIDKSQWISARSGGAFDITFASMGKMWRFGDGGPRALPDPREVVRARARIDYRRVERDAQRRAVRLARADTRISLGGIAKGYAVDRAVATLRSAGLRSFMVQAGGDLYLAGRKPDGRPWQAGIRDPRGPRDAPFATMAITDHAFSTAGDYERAFVTGGQRYHHIIDPRTGYPATASRSVTIWAKDALTADAVDDAVFIVGPAEGLRLVESIDGCGAVIVDADNHVHVSERLRGRVHLLHQPTAGI